jgi:hypothetical protein
MRLAAGGGDHIVLPSPPHQAEPKSTMSMRVRKLIGTFALFALVIVWALIAMAIAQFPPIFGHTWVAAIYYVVAGLGWVLPAMPLLRWMLTGSIRSR